MAAELFPAIAKAAAEGGVLKEVYGDLAKPGVSQVGKALSTIIGLGNTALWPIQLLNEKARIALDSNLERYRQKLAAIPPECVAPVAPEVGVPVAERLGYTQDVDLRELYTTLLAKASSTETRNQAHPSFVSVINNLSPDEAKLLKQQFKQKALPFVAAKLSNPANGHWLLLQDLVIPLLPEVSLTFRENLNAYFSNLEGLGLITVSRDTRVIPESLYEAIEAEMREQFKGVSVPEYPVLVFERGRVDVTHFGRLFLVACVK